jgi:hypothetical protein
MTEMEGRRHILRPGDRVRALPGSRHSEVPDSFRKMAFRSGLRLP